MALALDDQHWPARFNLAWLLATADNDEFRDGSRAVELAQSAYDAGDFGNFGEAEFLRILAAAYAEAGEVEKAIENCEKAIELAGDKEKLLSDLKKHLASYKTHKPWRLSDTEK
jgi:tetratricopeptide (TPR) repeat protein